MDGPLIAARAIHYGAQISLAGIFGFITLVAWPAYARAGLAMPSRLQRKLAVAAWASLSLTILSAIPWLFFVAQSMSAKPFDSLVAQGVVATVLTHTRFGHAFVVRVILVALLVPPVMMMGRRRQVDALGALLGAALLAATAWQGHAGAEEGVEGMVHVGADAVHLIAAGGWLGTLLPLAWLLGESRRADDRSTTDITRAAVTAFSDLGLSCVAALLVTGSFNAWLLVGTLPALIGTPYGQMLLLKIALFIAMLMLAALNRFHLLPSLAPSGPGRKAVQRQNAVASIERNALIEALLGLGIIAIVAALGTQVPAAHEQPWWPFPYRFGLDEIVAVPELRKDAIGTGILALLGLALMGFGWRRRRVLPIVTGLVLFFGLGWRPIQLLMVAATPTSYYISPESFAVRSILAGGKVYTEHCVDCHGKAGLGDGPQAAELPIAPADLTYHLSAHTDGDLFWFINSGMDAGVMPPFAATLDETQRWDVIAALRAHSDSEEDTLSADVTTYPAPRAPDFSFPATEGAPGTLKALLARDNVLLVLADGPQSRLAARLEDWRSVLAASGVSLLVVADDPQLRSVYAFYDPSPHRVATSRQAVAFLIDRDGYIRACWHPGDTPDWGDIETLNREIVAMGRLKLAPVIQNVHVH